MNLVEGSTMTQLLKNSNDYINKNYKLIEHAYITLLDEMTNHNIMAFDLSNNNYLWDKNTNTITLIDIDPTMLNKTKTKIIDVNEYMKNRFLQEN